MWNKNPSQSYCFVQQSSSYRISSSLWPLVKKWNKLGEGRQVKYRRPKVQMTGFFWRICTYTWFGLKAIIPLGGGNKEISLLFVFFGLYDLLDPRNSLSFVSCVRRYNSQVLRARIEEVLPHVSLQVRWEASYRLYCLRTR